MPKDWVFLARFRPRGCEGQQVTGPGAAGSPPQDPPAGRALGGRSRTGLSAPRRLMPRCASAGQAADVPLWLKTARRPFKGEVSPCLGAAVSPAVRDPSGLWVTRAGAGPPSAAPRAHRRGAGSPHLPLEGLLLLPHAWQIGQGVEEIFIGLQKLGLLIPYLHDSAHLVGRATRELSHGSELGVFSFLRARSLNVERLVAVNGM